MTSNNQWQNIKFKEILTLSLPPGVAISDSQGVDSSFVRWQGAGITISIDYGLFVDRLNAYENRPHYRQSVTLIDGYPARVVSFDRADGSHFTALHFQQLPASLSTSGNKLTLILELSSEMSPNLSNKIIQSIQFIGDN